MEKIVASLLEAEQLSTRHVTLNRSRVRIQALIMKLIDDFFDRDRDRISLADGFDELEANVDEARISLLLKNLIANALRYVPEAGGRVEVAAFADGNDLVISVHDNGPGMSSDQAEHIGEPFYRGDPSRTRETGGSGLGLYLATLVAEAHGGSLRLANPDQDGACLECRIPFGFNISS
jgi:signal transduction histidine kinase